MSATSSSNNNNNSSNKKLLHKSELRSNRLMEEECSKSVSSASMSMFQNHIYHHQPAQYQQQQQQQQREHRKREQEAKNQMMHLRHRSYASGLVESNPRGTTVTAAASHQNRSVSNLTRPVQQFQQPQYQTHDNNFFMAQRSDHLHQFNFRMRSRHYPANESLKPKIIY